MNGEGTINPAAHETGRMWRRVATLAAAGSLLAACGGNDNGDGFDELEVGAAAAVAGGSESTNPDSASPEAATSSTEAVSDDEAGNLIRNIWDNPVAEWECLDEGKATGNMVIVEDKVGNDFVGQVLLSNLDVDGTVRSDDYRMWSDAISSPIVGDLTDRQEVADNLYATWCNEPAALAPVLIEAANSTMYGKNIGQEIEWLTPYVGMTVEEDGDEVAASLTTPEGTDKEFLTEEEFAAYELRVSLAEKMANAFQNMQNHGVHLNVNIVDRVGLKLPEMLDTDQLPQYSHTGAYIGNAILFGVTEKENDCDTLIIGFNIDDKSPIIVGTDIICEPVVVPPSEGPTPPPEDGTTPPSDTTPDKVPSGTPRGGTGSGGSGEEGDGSDDSDQDGHTPVSRGEADRDDDGIHNSIDSCPDEAEDYDGFEDEDGCPEDGSTTTTTAAGVATGTAPSSTGAPVAAVTTTIVAGGEDVGGEDEDEDEDEDGTNQGTVATTSIAPDNN